MDTCRRNTERFLGEPNGVTRANEKIYVTHTGSRTKVFDAKDRHFIACLGNGNWGRPVFQAQALAVKNGLIYTRDKAAKQWINPIKSIKGFAFSQAARIYGQDEEKFWISDLKKQAVVRMEVYQNEIREYSRISDRIIRIDAVPTSKGLETAPFFVDIRTHEIVDPETIGQ